MSLAINCAYAKIYEDAIEYYEHLLRNSQLLNQQELLPHIYHNMGDLYFKMKNFSLSIAYFNMAVNHYEKEDVHFASALLNLGLTEMEMDKKRMLLELLIVCMMFLSVYHLKIIAYMLSTI